MQKDVSQYPQQAGQGAQPPSQFHILSSLGSEGDTGHILLLKGNCEPFKASDFMFVFFECIFKLEESTASLQFKHQVSRWAEGVKKGLLKAQCT